MGNVYTKMQYASDEAYTLRCEADKLVKYIEQFVSKDNIVWLPFDNELSNIYRSLKSVGFKCVLSNLELGLDFYNYEPDRWDIIITNPPFSGRTNIMKRLMSFNKPFIILQAVQYFNNRFATNLLCDNYDFQFIMPQSRMMFLQYDKKLNKVISNISGIAFYSFWVCYKIKLPYSFNLLKDSGKEKEVEEYDLEGNVIQDSHYNLFNFSKRK